MMLDPSSGQTRKILRTIFYVLIVFGIVLLVMTVQKTRNTQEIRGSEIPLSFEENMTTFAGALVNIGIKGGRTITQISFDQGEVSEPLPVGNLNIILVPDATDISDGALLSSALTNGKRIFGYKYSSRDAAAEIAAKERADNGEPLTYSELFPGQFFVSDAERNSGSFIADFEGQKSISFLSLPKVTLERDARYVIIASETATALTVRGLPVCGNGNPAQGGRDIEAEEECDDGNTISGDGCSATCVKEDIIVQSFPTNVINTGHWWSGVSGEFAILIDDPLDNITPDKISTTTVLFPRVIKNCIGSVCYPEGTPLQSAFIKLSRLPSTISRLSNLTLHIYGNRGFSNWNNIVHIRLVATDHVTPLTDWAELPALPKLTGSPLPPVDVSLSPLQGVSPALWADPTLEISTNWSYCTVYGTSCSSSGPLSTSIEITALSLSSTVQCDGICESVAPSCPNGILERFVGEECDDGDQIDVNICSNSCLLTNNWWIDELSTIGPLLHLNTDMAEGEIFVQSPDAGFALWYEGYSSSTDTYEALLVSHFTRDHGWTPPQQLNTSGMSVTKPAGPTAFNNVVQKPLFFRDTADRVTLFFDDGITTFGRLMRTTFDALSKTWSVPIRVSDTQFQIYETSRIDGTQGVMLLSLPLTSPHLGTYIDYGLYALTYRDGVWSNPFFLLKYEETTQGLQRIATARNVVGNDPVKIRAYIGSTQGLPQSAAVITGVNGAAYGVNWYGTSITVTVP